MFARFFKPKWQHKDAKVRLQGLTSLAPDSVELIQLAESDPDNSVRFEAIGRLSHMPTLLKLAEGDNDLAERARQRMLVIVTKDGQYDATLLNHFEWLEQHPALLKSIARDPKRLLELRKRALPTLDDQDLLYSIAYDDESRDIQALAAASLTNLTQLQTLEKRHGKNNKRLRQLVKDKIAEHDSARATRHALEACCVEVEALGTTERWEQDKTQLLVLKQRWKMFNDIPAPLMARFNAAEEDFKQRLATHEEQTASLRPLREQFLQLLAEANQWHRQLREQPEYVAVSELDLFLKSSPNEWLNLPMLPLEQQTALNEDWQEALDNIRQIRISLEKDFGALNDLTEILKQADHLLQNPQGLQASKITALQSTWTSAPRPHVLRVRISELEQQFHQLIGQLSTRLTRETKQREELKADFDQQIQHLEQALEQEHYSQAIELHHNLQQQLKAAPLLSTQEAKPIRDRLQAMYPLIRELADWRNWGTDQAREHLIESAEHLQLTELDPQERAKRIKALRNEWRNLSAQAPHQPQRQWREFDRKVTAAYEPSKQHFAEQARLRQEHLTQREALCAELEQLNQTTDWAQPDWKALQKQIAQLRQRWKESGTVSHKDWQAINTRFNAAMEALEAHLDIERQHNWAERLQLVTQAEALLEEDDIAQATENAKQLQSQWFITVPARQGEEQRLWKQFRAPIDTLFERLKSERQNERSELQQAIDTKIGLCEQLEALAQTSVEDWSTVATRQRQLYEDFQAIRNLPKSVHIKLETRWQAAEKALQVRGQQVAQLQQWQQLEQIAANQVLSDEPSDSIRQQGEIICLDLEILLGLQTPEAYQKQRMNYQIERMSESMLSRKETRQVEPQAFKLFKQWYRLPLDPLAFATQQSRIQAAIDAMQTQQGLHKPSPKAESNLTAVTPTETAETEAPVAVTSVPAEAMEAPTLPENVILDHASQG
ncbi:DUF349 domain-containing protein [Thiofilum flexile]|uniref:DUF349 domain-containing protein n=1 Tax=Thiofilum flexile TaxID=125627 RepID=UPI0003807B83|nr:DUF349 domain-containing protein [Thiofilum flexile]